MESGGFGTLCWLTVQLDIHPVASAARNPSPGRRSLEKLFSFTITTARGNENFATIILGLQTRSFHLNVMTANAHWQFFTGLHVRSWRNSHTGWFSRQGIRVRTFLGFQKTECRLFSFPEKAGIKYPQFSFEGSHLRKTQNRWKHGGLLKYVSKSGDSPDTNELVRYTGRILTT